MARRNAASSAKTNDSRASMLSLNCRLLILATRRQPSTTSRKISRTSTGCRLRVSRPASARARARSSSINEVVLSASSRMCCNASLYSDSPRDLLRANSASVRTSEMGVRSSWEASAVNCVTRRKASSMRSSISFNVSDRRCSSSPVFSFSSRLLSVVPVMDRAVRTSASTGDNALRLSQYPPPAATSSSIGANMSR